MQVDYFQQLVLRSFFVICRVKKYISYLLIGFFAAAYLAVPMFGIAILGAAMAVISFQQNLKDSQRVVVANAGVSQEGLLDGEYED